MKYKTNMMSNCCKAGLIARGDVTRWFECLKCNTPCDMYTEPSKFTRIIRFIKLCWKYFWIGFKAVFIDTYKDIWNQTK